MIKVNITEAQYIRATQLYQFKSLNESITRGKGNIIGALGEIIVHDTWNTHLKFPKTPSYHYDLIHEKKHVKIDVKSKKISNHVVPASDFKVSISTNGLGVTQECDWYVFCYITENHKSGYILGWYNKHKYLTDSIYKRKGDIDDIGRVLNKGWRFKANGYIMLVGDLKQVPLYDKIQA